MLKNDDNPLNRTKLFLKEQLEKLLVNLLDHTSRSIEITTGLLIGNGSIQKTRGNQEDEIAAHIS